MSYLFVLEGDRVKPNVETLLVYPFKDIWERCKDKGDAIKLFSYIEFMVSKERSNPYRDYEEEERDRVLRRDVIRLKDWSPDKLVKDGMRYIRGLQEEGNVHYRFYMSAKNSVEKVIKFLDSVDMDERDDKGKLVHSVKGITGALLDTGKVSSSLKELEKNLYEELFEKSRMRSDKEISSFSNPDMIPKEL